MPGKLATDSKAHKGLKRHHVNVAGLEGKLSHLIRGGLALLKRQKSAEAIVVDGVTTIRGGQGNLTTGRRAERDRS